MSDLRDAARQALEALDLCRDWPGAYDECSQAITALRAALEQPEQEPVAWVEKDGELVWCDKARATGRNLYIHPPRREWRGLTEEEINDCWASHDKTGEQITRAIEAALKERNA